MKPKKNLPSKKSTKKQTALAKKKTNKLRELAYSLVPESPEGIAFKTGVEIGTQRTKEKLRRDMNNAMKRGEQAFINEINWKRYVETLLGE